MVAVLKTVVRQRTGGSNPSSSVDEESVSCIDIGSFLLPNCPLFKELQAGRFRDETPCEILFVLPLFAECWHPK